MELTDDAPRFPKWPFLAGDAALLAVAVYIALAAEAPLPAAAIYTIAACVGLGAVLATLPFIIDYNRRQEALLTDRQNALEALARTAAAAAEQASIAASGLHEIAELAHKNLRLAEHLPQKLHERVAEFNRTQDEALSAELESLQQEVNTLRASEAERLESAADKIHRSTSELAKMEGGLRQQITAVEEAARRAQAAVAAAAAQAMAGIEQHQQATAAPSAESPSPAPTDADKQRRPRSIKPPPPPAAVPGAGEPAPPPESEHIPVPPESTAGPAAASDSGAHPASVTAPIAPPPTPANGESVAAHADRKPTARRRGSDSNTPLLGGLLAEDPAPAVISEPVVRRGPRHGVHAPGATPVGEQKSDPSAGEKPPTPITSQSTDGLTRLIVTAYIGIGNKLFVRGEGPGLSKDRGVPLQFVSIGKWRWESADVQQPVSVRLFKNDQIECAELGELALEPGRQHEVTANF